MPRSPLGTVMVMLRRLARSSAPARFAQPSCSCIHARQAGRKVELRNRHAVAIGPGSRRSKTSGVGTSGCWTRGDKSLQGRVPVLKQLLRRRRELGLVALGRAFRLRGMRHRRVGDVHGLGLRRRFPELPGLVRRLPERENGFDLLSHQQRFDQRFR